MQFILCYKMIRFLFENRRIINLDNLLDTLGIDNNKIKTWFYGNNYPIKLHAKN